MADGSSRTVNVAIIGAGGISSAHASAVRELDGVELKAVAEIDEKRREEWIARHGRDGEVAGYGDYREMLKRDDVDLVVVTLPHWLHGEAGIAALEAGKHLLVEKPMAMTLEDCGRMIEIAEEGDLRLGVGLTHHFHKVPVEVKRILDSGRLGPIVWGTQVNYTTRRYGSTVPWYFDREKGGGQLMSNGVHYIDRLLWMIGGPADVTAVAMPERARPVAVSAIVGTYFNRHEPAYRADDGSILLVRFDTGQVATIHLTGYYQGIRDGFSEYCCQKGMLKYTGQQILTTNPEDPEDYEYHEVPVEGGMGFTAQMADMVDAVRTGRSPAVPGEWGRLVMQVLLAAEESARSGREIRLDG